MTLDLAANHLLQETEYFLDMIGRFVPKKGKQVGAIVLASFLATETVPDNDKIKQELSPLTFCLRISRNKAYDLVSTLQ